MKANSPLVASSIYNSIKRVIQQSDCSAKQFYQGMFFRVLERCFEFIPFLLCYTWLNIILRENQGFWHIAEMPYQNKSWMQSGIVEFSFLLLVCFICQLVFSYLGQRQSFLGSYQIMAAYREALISRVRQLPLGRLYQYRAGQLAEILTDDIKRLESIFTHVVADFVAAAVAPALLVVGLLWVDWRLALSLVAALPFALWVLNKTRLLFFQVGERKQEMFRDTAGLLSEFVMGIKTLRLFNCSDVWVDRLTQRFEQIKKISLGVEAWGAGPVISYRLVLEFGLVVLFLVLAKLAETEVNILSGLLFLLLAYKLLEPLLEVAEQLTVLRYALRSENKIQTLFAGELLPEPKDCIRPRHFDLSFENVYFAYDEEPVLQDVSFVVPQNSMTAIVGLSGAGKSSVVNLLARFYDPQSGIVKLGGLDLKSIGTDCLYEHVSMVFQQVQLYAASIMDNVRIGSEGAMDEDVIAACKAANCDQFIRQLSQGYQTWVGENGVFLSGGERQRLSIARALLKDAPVLLLDEATASVDPETQHEIQSSLSRLAAGRTLVMIAHRLSTVVNADQIIVIEQGKIVERGNHKSLLESGGLYKKMWQAQKMDSPELKISCLDL